MLLCVFLFRRCFADVLLVVLGSQNFITEDLADASSQTATASPPVSCVHCLGVGVQYHPRSCGLDSSRNKRVLL